MCVCILQNLIELEKFRKLATKHNRVDLPVVSCNEIKTKIPFFSLNEFLNESIKNLKESQKRKQIYLIGEWAKISLFLIYRESQFIDNTDDVSCHARHGSLSESFDTCHGDCSYDRQILTFFELARNPEFDFDFGSSFLERLKGSIGLLHDQFLSILWILVINFNSKLLIFKVNLNLKSFKQKIQKINEICTQNTETLKNTEEISKDSAAIWWKLRKFLDFELLNLCNELSEEMFSNISVITLF